MKSIFDAFVRKELVTRLNSLTSNSSRRFGTMNPDQMVHHVNELLEMYLEPPTDNVSYSKPKAAIMRMFTFSPIPIPKGSPTPRQFVAAGKYDLESEKQRFMTNLEKFAAKKDQSKWPVSPAFGDMTPEQVGKLHWKHVDHHLKQFGV